MSILEELQPVCTNLLMPSESEYPIEPVVRQESSWEAILQGFGAAPMEETTLEQLLAKIAFPQEWHDSQQQQLVSRFQALMETLQAHLSQIRVFRVGAIEVRVYILGQTTDGAIAGVQTTLIET
ncbi:MAG: nuclease [Oscillatoriales cyanobacterium SM2_2_1]|nr:nuclease [Oscillatoriales cyanobacterium SM2_2_1]